MGNEDRNWDDRKHKTQIQTKWAVNTILATPGSNLSASYCFVHCWRTRVQRMRSSTMPSLHMLSLSVTVPRSRIMRSIARGRGVMLEMLYALPSLDLIIRQLAVTPA